MKAFSTQFGSLSLLRRCALGRRRARAFTLIELMVALSGGLLFTIFVFMMARDATRFYQSETRLADATFGSISGFQRLRTDIARAGYLSTPNIQSSTSTYCGDVNNAALGGLKDLASIQIEQGGSPANYVFTKNSLTPDAIFLMGSYASAEQFPIESVDLISNSWVVHFQPNSAAMLRLGYAADPTVFDKLFLPGRALRIVDHAGQEQYGIVSMPDSSTATDPFVTLAKDPGFQRKSSGTSCGLRGFEAGALVNVVQMIRYEIRDLSALPEYAPLYPGVQAATGEQPGERTELVREERDFADPTTVLQNTTTELVAEFAVDLKFGLTVLDPTNLVNGTTKLADPTDIPDYAGPASAPGTKLFGAGQIRAVRARLSVRSRSPDRSADAFATPTDPLLARYRVDVAPDGAPPEFARVRTLQADIALRNQPSAR